ncbi:MAG: hypothetical protein JKY48_01440 [Flavobacteriales bacterium]|nr:hypothetical protein [Flavobacteriales bacterium]
MKYRNTIYTFCALAFLSLMPLKSFAFPAGDGSLQKKIICAIVSEQNKALVLSQSALSFYSIAFSKTRWISNNPEAKKYIHNATNNINSMRIPIETARNFLVVLCSGTPPLTNSDLALMKKK